MVFEDADEDVEADFRVGSDILAVRTAHKNIKDIYRYENFKYSKELFNEKDRLR